MARNKPALAIGFINNDAEIYFDASERTAEMIEQTDALRNTASAVFARTRTMVYRRLLVTPSTAGTLPRTPDLPFQ